MKERLKSGYVKMGITVFAAGAALIVLYEVIIHFNQVQEAWSVLSTILSPFIFGLVMAYLLCPVYNVTVRRMYRPAQKAFRTKKTALRFARVIGTFVSLIVLFGVIGGLFALVLPETLRSIIGLIQVMPDRFNDLIDWLREPLRLSEIRRLQALLSPS